MRKLVFSVVAIAMLASCALFAQEESGVKRTINGYLAADSGDILNDKEDGVGDTLWSGNEFEIGLSYTQNFASVDWLSFRVRFNAVMSQSPIFYENGDYAGQNGSTTSGINATSPRGQVMLAANGAGFGVDGLSLSLAVDTRTKMDIYANYGLAAGPGRLTFGLGVELYANPIASATASGGDADDHIAKVLDLFVITAGYSMKFNDVWGFNTTLYGRFQGAAAAYDASENDPKQDGFADNFELRWDLNATAAFAGGLGMSGGIRLDVENLLHDREVDVDLKLRAGVSYTFNL